MTRSPTSPRRLRGDRGSSDALGIALIAPAAIGLALVVLFLGRGVDSRATVHVAAESAAQAAARTRTPSGAIAAAQAAADAMLGDELTCPTPSVTVDVTDFRAGGVVSVTVACTPATRGLEPVGVAAQTQEVTAYATIDPLRGTEGSP